MLTSLIYSLGWSLIHSLWQAAVIYLVLQTLLKYFKNSPARVRCMLSATALTGIFICFLLTFYAQWENTLTNITVNHIPATLTAADVVSLPYFSGPSIPGSTTSGWLIYLVSLYAVGLLFFLGRVLRDLYLMQSIRHTRAFPFDPAWEKYLSKLANAWQISRNVGLYLSEKIDVPVVIGYFKPVIYLPFSIVNNLTPEQIETILLHELAHIKRADFLVNIIQTIMETLLFFNPFVWLLSKNIRQERELACDEWVIAEKEPKIYAESLLALEENRWHKGKFTLAAISKKQQLYQRIKNIMEMKKRKLNVAQKLLVTLFIVGSIVSISWLVPQKETTPDHSQNSIAERASKAVKDTTPPLPAPPKTAPGAATIPPPATPATPSSPDANPLPDPPAPPAGPDSPAPAAPAVSDSLPDGLDSVVANAAATIRQYFNSDDWKHYKQSVKGYAASLRQYFQSNEWQQQKENIQQQAQALRQQLTSKNWQLKMDSFQTALSNNMPNLDSILSEVHNQVALLRDSSITIRNNKAHNNLQVNRLINRMRQDGLIRNNEPYKIRLDDRGLFVNGKKQPEQYYKKYRTLVGDHTKIKIKKEKDSYSSSISTSD